MCFFASPTFCRNLLLLHLQPRFGGHFGGHNVGQKRLLKTEWKEVEMQNLTYTSRGLRRRRNSDRWEAVLSHADPVTGEVVRTFHTVEGKTRRQAERARDALILELERKGGAVGSSMSVREFMDQFLAYKEGSGTIEPSTVRGYRAEARQIGSYIGTSAWPTSPWRTCRAGCAT